MTVTGLASFSHWIHLEAKDHDLEFVQTVLYFSTQILNRSSPPPNPSCSSATGEGGGSKSLGRGIGLGFVSGMAAPSSSGCGGAESSFHVHPKKITEVRREERGENVQNERATHLQMQIHVRNAARATNNPYLFLFRITVEF